MSLKRPETQKLQKESILAVETIVNEMNCEFRRLEPDNAGIDGEIDLVKAFHFEGKILKVQIKAGKSYITSDNEDFIRVKVERKYVELWKNMNVPVLLLFYHPISKTVYWKGIKEYLFCEPKLLNNISQNIVIPFDKNRDVFSRDVLPNLRLVVEGQFEYEKILLINDRKEIILSNWFPVLKLPQQIFHASTSYESAREIKTKLNGFYSFIIKSNRLYTFSDLNYEECELRKFCDCGVFKLESLIFNDIEHNWYMELLNRIIAINCYKNYMVKEGNRFYFSSAIINDESLNHIKIRPLRGGKDTQRSKFYSHKEGQKTEIQHMAVKLAFIKTEKEWFFQIQPDWYFTYPNDPTKTNKEIGVRIIKEKAKLYNHDYLYLLHAWKEFLSNNSDLIAFSCDDSVDSQKIIVNTSNKAFTSNFMLFNDYSQPKGND